MTYTTETVNMGHVKKQDVRVVRMPRATFLREVDATLAGYPERIVEKLRPVAKTMDVFPLDDWINATRGCDCLVGEYLIATDLITRDLGNNNTVFDAMRQDPDHEALEHIGEDVDHRLSHEIMSNLAYGDYMPMAIVITDDEEAEAA